MAANRFLATTHAWLCGFTRVQLEILLTLLLALIGYADYLIGADISLSILYLLPAGIATWYVGRNTGIALALASAVFSQMAHIGTGRIQAHPWLTAWNGFLHFCFMLIIVHLLAHLHAHLRVEQQLAKKDALTGIFNRRAFMESLQYILDMAAREHWPVTLTYVDVDDFKDINDSKGHAEGDRVLRMIASGLVQPMRHTDVVARLGGDEFALILPHADRRTAEHLVERLRAAIVDEGSPVTCSIGCVTFLAPTTAEYAVMQADMLMYEAKKHGKNRVAFAESGARLADRA